MNSSAGISQTWCKTERYHMVVFNKKTKDVSAVKLDHAYAADDYIEKMRTEGYDIDVFDMDPLEI